MKEKLHIGILDYIKGVKIGDRLVNLGSGFKSYYKIHRNKKKYNRKDNKKIKPIDN
jgi:hypothetical protein